MWSYQGRIAIRANIYAHLVKCFPSVRHNSTVIRWGKNESKNVNKSNLVGLLCCRKFIAGNSWEQKLCT